MDIGLIYHKQLRCGVVGCMSDS